MWLFYSENRHKEDYVFNYFFRTFHVWLEEPPFELIPVVNERLQAGHPGFYKAMKPYMENARLSEKWKKPFIDSYKAFKAAPEMDDDIPF